MKKYYSLLILLLILTIGAFLRLYNVNWDQNQHLHPDERFLTMVGNAMRVPSSFFEYLDPIKSGFNPANINFKFFVYGIFPLTINKLVAIILGNDTYDLFTSQGRILSGLFDILTIFIVYKIVELFEKKYHLSISIKYLASFFYAIAVLPIQLSHFFAVDTFLNFFTFVSCYFALRFALIQNNSSFSKISLLFLSALFFGFSIASKVSAIYILPLNIFFILLPNLGIIQKKFSLVFLYGILYLFITYCTLRIADPYLFESNNFLNPQISNLFKENLTLLKSWGGKDVWFPPAVQWLHKPPVLFSLINTILFGVGAPYFSLIILGGYIVIKKRQVALMSILLWTVLFFVYQSTQVFKTIRYFIILYPFFAIFAGIGFYHLAKKLHFIFKVILICTVIIWPLLFFSIYTQKHSRVKASAWIYENLENGSFILTEHWDDPLPLLIQQNMGKTFLGEQLPIFDPDTPTKWKKMNELLEKGDYYVLSSNRGWGSITTAPDRYPRMSRFYHDLLDGKSKYQKIKEFTSYPSLTYLGIPIELPDELAEETFTVYDHPKVLIFKKTQ